MVNHSSQRLVGKQCRKCRITKSVSEFYLIKGKPAYRCKDCQKAAQRADRRAVPRFRPKTRHYTMEEVHRIAAERGLKCLSSKYQGSKARLKWRCARGHAFEARLDAHAEKKFWCQQCWADSKKLSFDKLKAIARSRGGACLSQRYLGAIPPMRWRCAQGHEWSASASDICKGGWCAECHFASRRLTLEGLQQLAASRGGECLSTTYANSVTNLRWRCEKGHEWEAPAGNIKAGHWCQICRREATKLTIDDARAYASSQGGICLSEEYVDSKAPLKWQCKKGHHFEASIGNIKPQNAWCAECAGNAPITLEDMRSLAAARGGKLLSAEVWGSRRKLEWRCANAHEFKASPDAVRKGWCPECSLSFSERIVRVFFETLFGKSFPKQRPEWLRSPSGSWMELDGYCSELRLAFEHHGRQHYEFIPFFHKGKQDFLRRRKLDQLKARLCRNKGVVLIEIPSLDTGMTKINDMREMIACRCRKEGIQLPENYWETDVDLRRAYLGS